MPWESRRALERARGSAQCSLESSCGETLQIDGFALTTITVGGLDGMDVVKSQELETSWRRLGLRSKFLQQTLRVVPGKLRFSGEEYLTEFGKAK